MDMDDSDEYIPDSSDMADLVSSDSDGDLARGSEFGASTSKKPEIFEGKAVSESYDKPPREVSPEAVSVTKPHGLAGFNDGLSPIAPHAIPMDDDVPEQLPFNKSLKQGKPQRPGTAKV